MSAVAVGPERCFVSWETYNYLRREVARLKVERRDRASLYREISTLTVELERARHEIERQRAELNRRYLIGAAA
ncbi:hypothetical protein [Microbacterium capsulatum]|uniref:Uncharacterized protein n=1 Tax=Microbacterium capsulatum TaxID=3041921 RepID=A0ABU0XF74_9MICO|nr:hypothetical protein [Microbacterium sp. ASV81]MDQ4213273.1 hypothetical protein [Microbacterium sp. ASV81]